MSAIIDIEATHVTGSGQRYRVWHNGEILIESCREPLCSAARELSKAGYTGRIETRDFGSEKVKSSGLIAVLATLTVTEGQSSGPRFSKWTERQFDEAAE